MIYLLGIVIFALIIWIGWHIRLAIRLVGFEKKEKREGQANVRNKARNERKPA